MYNLKNIQKINKILTFILIGLIAYILVFPVIPQINYMFYSLNYKEPELQKIDTSINNEADQNIQNKKIIDFETASDTENWLKIPKIGVEAPINEGLDVSTLDLGLWRRPNTSTPEAGGNSVITAHRFLYTSGPNTFYHLDKLEKGDKIYSLWENKVYEYEVFEIRVIEPWMTNIEKQTEESILTLYTCTPLWTAENRLVVKAKLSNMS